MTSDSAAAPEAVPAAELDELFAGPPGNFVRVRDDLARRLRGDGERDAAAWVKRLRRPTLAAWAVNRAVREHDDLRDELLAATAELADAQARLLAGKAGGAELRAAAERQRTAEGALVRAVRGLRDDAGNALGEAVLERVRETLAAVVLDEDARAELASGRLTRERRAAGLGGFDTAHLDAGDAPQAGTGRMAGRRSGAPAAPGAKGGKRSPRRAEATEERPASGTGARGGRSRSPAAPGAEHPTPAEHRASERERRLRELRETLAEAERAQVEAEARSGAAAAEAREAGERVAAARAAQAAADEALARARTEERSAARAVGEAKRRLRRVER